MEFCLSQGSSGPEVGMLIDNLRKLGFDLEAGADFTPKVSGALRLFQQSYHDHAGLPLKIDGKLGMATALALDNARGRSAKRMHFDDKDIPSMSQGGSPLARRAASIAYDEYIRACGEQSGDNLGPDVSRYQSVPSRRGLAWSVDFAAYCYREAFQPEMSAFGVSHNTDELIEMAQSRNWLLPTISDGFLPGDLIVWHHNEPKLRYHPNWQGQVGIVWRHQHGNLITLEGDRGPYPSLVRPYRHKVTSLLDTLSNHSLRKGVSVIRVTGRN